MACGDRYVIKESCAKFGDNFMKMLFHTGCVSPFWLCQIKEYCPTSAKPSSFSVVGRFQIQN
jgi:hypothetical protein